jgi:hypothetical protein
MATHPDPLMQRIAQLREEVDAWRRTAGGRASEIVRLRERVAELERALAATSQPSAQER